MSESSNNYFNLPMPQNWSCALWEINSNHQFRFRLFIPYQPGSLWVSFDDVLYFDGPLTFNAQFQLSTSEDALALLRSLRDDQIRHLLDDELLKAYKLFQVSVSQHFRVQILAQGTKFEDTSDRPQ